MRTGKEYFSDQELFHGIGSDNWFTSTEASLRFTAHLLNVLGADTDDWPFPIPNPTEE